MRKRTVIGIGTCLIAIALSASVLSTVAWYNGSSHLQIENFNIGFSSKELKISTDNVDFKDRLGKNDLNQVDKFIPVSSMFSSFWLNSKQEQPVFRKGFDEEEVRKTTYTSIDDYAVAESGFLSQVLYLKSDTDASATLDIEKTYVRPNEDANNDIANKLASKYPEMSHEQIVNNLNKISDSLRMSILVLDEEQEHELDDYAYYIIDPHKNGDTLYGGLLDNDLDGYYDNYDGKEVLFGEANNVSESTLVYTDEKAHHEGKSYSIFEASTKDNVKHLDLGKSVDAGLQIAKENSLSLVESQDIRISLKTNVSKRIVFSLYLEGWDLDNTNLSMYAHFYMSLVFKLA